MRDLIGRVSQSSDMKVVHSRNRYLVTNSIGPASYFRMQLPRVSPDSYLDCRTLKMRFGVTITSTDPLCAIDANWHFPSVVFACFPGQPNAHLLQLAIYNATQDNSISAYQQALLGDVDLTTRRAFALEAGHEYIIDMFPPNTILNGQHILDVNSTSDITVEFWTLTPQQYLFSPANDVAATFQISGVQILSSYISSPSLQQYFAQNPLSFTVTDVSSRYQTIAQVLSQIQLSSSSTSLNGILCLMRNQSIEASVANQNKCTTLNSNGLVSLQLLVNQMNWFDQAIDLYPQLFHELELFQDCSKAAYFTSLFTTTRFMAGVRLSASPPQFADTISSGVKTSALNSDLVVQMQFSAAPGTIQRVDSYLFTDVTIFKDGSTAIYKFVCRKISFRNGK